MVDRLLAKGMLAGVDLALFGGDPFHLMIAVTEKRTKAEIDALVETLGDIG